MKRLVIFDLDGTLLDSIHDIANSLNVVRAGVSLPPKTVAQTTSYVGNGLHALIRRGFDDFADEAALHDELFAQYVRHYDAHCTDKSRVFDGVLDALDELRQNSVVLAINTNKQHDFLDRILRTYYSQVPFAAVAGAGPFPPKPDPAGVFDILHRTGFSPADCVYVGDSATDVATAKNAGVMSVGVCWGYGGEAELLSAGADHIVKTPRELAKIILSL